MVLYAQGEREPAVHFLRSGWVTLSTTDIEGAERRYVTRGPRSLLGIEAIDGSPSTFEIRALTAVQSCRLGSQDMGRWLGSPGSPARAVLELNLAELRQQQNDTRRRRGRCLPRVARFVLELGSAPAPEPMPKQVMARILGMRAETFSRCLQRLSSDGVLDAHGGVRVLDWDRLAQVAKQN